MSVVNFPQVADSLAVGQKRAQDTDERVILFLKMAPEKSVDEKLVKDIAAMIRSQLSPRHVPAFILPIADIPVRWD